MAGLRVQLREGLKFHNATRLRAEDVRFSFERYRGVSAMSSTPRAKLWRPSIPRVRFVLHDPWPDFMRFMAPPRPPPACVVPSILEQVGEEGSKSIQ